MNKRSKTMVVKQCYIHPRHSMSLRLRKMKSIKKQGNLYYILLAIIVIILFVMITFVNSLYSITYCKKERFEVLQVNKVNGDNNSFLLKPKERWCYIKQLESRNLSTYSPINYSVSRRSMINNYRQSISKQNHLLTQIKTNENQQLVYINHLPWSRQVSLHQLQMGLCHQSQKQAHLKQLWYTTIKQPKAQQTILSTKKETSSLKKIEEEKNRYYWIVKCGSFKNMEQAEIMRARLAFKGFNSRIIINNGWNNVVISQVKSKYNADSIITNLKKIAGYKNSILLASELKTFNFLSTTSLSLENPDYVSITFNSVTRQRSDSDNNYKCTSKKPSCDRR